MNIQINDMVKAELFVSIFQHIPKFTEHVNIMLEADRFYVQSINSSHVIIMEVVLPASWFSVYSVLPDITMIGLHSALFYKVLKKREKHQKIHLECTEANTDYLEVHFTSTEGKEGEAADKTIFDKHFHIPSIDIETDLVAIPEMEYQAEFGLSSDAFANLISQLKDFGDALEIKCSEESIELCANSSENGRMLTAIPIEDLAEYAIEDGEKIVSEFALKYLHEIGSYKSISKQVEISLSRDFPMRILFRLGGSSTTSPKIEGEVEEEEGNKVDVEPKLLFFIAPKMAD
jgi:proliferating cell nuclear antigen PCNA